MANSIRIEASTKPSPVKISVSELLKQVRPLKQKADTTAVLSVVDSHGKFFGFLHSNNNLSYFLQSLLAASRWLTYSCRGGGPSLLILQYSCRGGGPSLLILQYKFLIFCLIKALIIDFV